MNDELDFDPEQLRLHETIKYYQLKRQDEERERHQQLQDLQDEIRGNTPDRRNYNDWLLRRQHQRDQEAANQLARVTYGFHFPEDAEVMIGKTVRPDPQSESEVIPDLPTDPRQIYDTIIKQALERAGQKGLSPEVLPTADARGIEIAEWFLAFWYPLGRTFEQYMQKFTHVSKRTIERYWVNYRAMHDIPTLRDLDKLRQGKTPEDRR